MEFTLEAYRMFVDEMRAAPRFKDTTFANYDNVISSDWLDDALTELDQRLEKAWVLDGRDVEADEFERDATVVEGEAEAGVDSDERRAGVGDAGAVGEGVRGGRGDAGPGGGVSAGEG